MAGTVKSKIPNELRNEAELQIKEMQKQIDYDTRDYTVEFLVNKFEKGDFFIPDYQRQYIWREKNKSEFIESIMLGLPIPFMFFGNCQDGRMEVIDGAQRLQTLVMFVESRLKLKGLKKLDKLNKFYFKDLNDARKRKFMDRDLRVIILEENTPVDVRQDLFNRINTTGIKANDSEIRRGSYPGLFTAFIEECSANELFMKLCPVSPKVEKRHERFELVLRFFAYVNEYEKFVHDVNVFLDQYLIRNLNGFDEQSYKNEFERMLSFVEKYFPIGFGKLPTSTSTPRVRFEALAVGTALALRQKPYLSVENINWIHSEEFKQLTTSDASNNQGKLRARIEYVRDKLLEG